MLVVQLLAWCGRTNAVLVGAVALYFFFWPLLILQQELRDPGLISGTTPAFVYRWHQQLSGDFAAWAQQRTDSSAPMLLNINDISGTEWPMFSAVYYLWATQALQSTWERGQSDSQNLQGLENSALSSTAPISYASEAIYAAAALIADSQNASWVIKHWGADYLERENLFYRMLLIAGLASFEQLTEDDRYASLLRDQVSKLSRELDASPHGLLDDYPGQCYPIDILPAIAVIKRAGQLSGQDFQPFAQRSLRGFSGSRLDPQTMLPAYIADRNTGQAYGPARGVGIAYMLIWAPELWPDVAREWYAKYQHYFWQQNRFLSGVREFPRGSKYADWTFDIDAGPVIAGFGTAASAFGIAAARANGRLDHAYPLSLQALVTSWPLPGGTRLIPRLLSNLSDAPYVGETALLFVFTRNPVGAVETTAARKQIPFYVLALLGFYLLAGIAVVIFAWSRYVRLQRQSTGDVWNKPGLQLAVWGIAAIGTAVTINFGSYLFALVGITLMLQFPRVSDKTGA